MTKEIKPLKMKVSGRDIAPEPYHYRACGLDDVFLLNGFERKETAYGHGVAIHDVEGLHKAIGTHIIVSRRRISAKEVRFLRKLMECTQESLAKALRVDVQTVARYEKGESGVSGPADLLIRLLYVLWITPENRREEVATEIRAILSDEPQEDASSPPKNFRHTSEGWNAGASLTH